jgi:hypothetical protein
MGQIAGILGMGSVVGFFVGLANFGGWIQIGGAQGVVMRGSTAVFLAPFVFLFAMFLGGIASRRQAALQETHHREAVRRFEAARAKQEKDQDAA